VVAVVGTVRGVVTVVLAEVVVGVAWGTVLVVVGAVVVVGADAVVVVSSLVDVVVVVTGTLVSEWAALAAYPTKSTDVAHEPKKIAWVTWRTRANRRSRCWGVRFEGVIDLLAVLFSHPRLRSRKAQPKKGRKFGAKLCDR
jgi:hypothetical protein